MDAESRKSAPHQHKYQRQISGHMSIITANNIGKKYRIGEVQPYLALRDTLTHMFKHPLAWTKSKITESISPNEFWALKEVNFSLEQGEVLGIIGRNGAGKSTLLKILSRITPPTTGEIRLKGKVGSLLEVGTGFHPELTGRENIFLNGAILGMRRREIVNKMDDIIEFSGIEKFIDTPVKRYSSGMYVRLAFSVAAHLEPDILIIDEVLAVGDAEFQKKCLGKMGEVTKSHGRTVLFVSHNMGAVQSICTRTMLLEKGKVKAIGDTYKVTQAYLSETTGIKQSEAQIAYKHNRDFSFTKVWVTDKNGQKTSTINVEDGFKIWLEFMVNQPSDGAEISLWLKNSSGVNVLYASLSDSFGGNFYDFKAGKYATSAFFPGNFLMPDLYEVSIMAHYRRGTSPLDDCKDVLAILINETGNSSMAPYGQAAKSLSTVLSNAKWEVEKI